MARARTRARGRPAPPELAGHEVVGPLGFGANGPAWLARTTTGDDVVVSVLSVPAGPAGRGWLRRLAALRHGSHPHLARIRQVVAMEGDRCAVVSDRVAGPSLDTVLQARGSLTEPELYALLRSVAGALAHLHGRGVIHGDVSPTNLVLTGAGDPVLVDLAGQVTHELGTAGFIAPELHRGSPASVAGDVWALARVVQWAAGAAPPRRLLDLLGEPLRAAPSRRPGARELERAAAAAGEYRPITLPAAAVLAQARMRAPDTVTRRRPGTRRDAQATTARARWRLGLRLPRVLRSRRTTEPAGHQQRRTVLRPRVEPPVAQTPRKQSSRPAVPVRHSAGKPQPRRTTGWRVGAVALALGAAALVVAPRIGLDGDELPPMPASAAGLDSALAVGVVTELLSVRDAALMIGDREALASVSVPGGPVALSDAALLETIVASGTRLDGLQTSVAEVRRVVKVGEGIAVEAVLTQTEHSRAVGSATRTVTAPAPGCTRIVLVAATGDDGGWQMHTTAPCD